MSADIEASPLNIALRFVGPYGFFAASGLPIAMDQPVAKEQGIYIWTVESPDGYRINYLGKTGGLSNRCFAQRFREEIDYDRSHGGRVDPDAFARCERVRITPATEAERREIAERNLATYRIFMAPVTLSKPLLLELEARCIHHLKHDDAACACFLANNSGWPKNLPMTITIEAQVRLIGFEEGRVYL